MTIDIVIKYIDNVVKNPGEGHLPTLKDIAQQAGVSIKTVSRVINNEPHITEDKRTRVMRIVRELNYVPNPAARSLKMGRTSTIAVTTGGPNLTQVFHHPYMSRLYSGMAAALDGTGYRLTFCHFKQIMTADEAIELATNRYADGILYILLSVYYQQFKKDRIVEQYRKLGIPYVVIHSMQQEIGCSSIGLDGGAGGYEAARHLLEHGYGSVGFVGAPYPTPHIDDMYAGFRRAMDEAGIAVPDHHLFRVRAFETVDPDLAGTIVRLGKKRPRALVVAMGGQAPGLISNLCAAGLRVPEDIAVIGFDEARSVPGLAYIEQPAFAKGKLAMEMVLAQVEGRGAGGEVRPVPRIVAGESCGCDTENDK